MNPDEIDAALAVVIPANKTNKDVLIINFILIFLSITFSHFHINKYNSFTSYLSKQANTILFKKKFIKLDFGCFLGYGELII